MWIHFGLLGSDLHSILPFNNFSFLYKNAATFSVFLVCTELLCRETTPGHTKESVSSNEGECSSEDPGPTHEDPGHAPEDPENTTQAPEDPKHEDPRNGFATDESCEVNNSAEDTQRDKPIIPSEPVSAAAAAVPTQSSSHSPSGPRPPGSTNNHIHAQTDPSAQPGDTHISERPTAICERTPAATSGAQKPAQNSLKASDRSDVSAAVRKPEKEKEAPKGGGKTGKGVSPPVVLLGKLSLADSDTESGSNFID